ncbi:Gfo/Idh/MocA family oxidoreductase [Flavobacteriaceae bacterium]|nr:Gfo/Idh/MocA family oxidoreductase [Flavobacteriaceae bacterium]
MKLGFGIVGSGSIAKVHAQCIQAHSNAELLGFLSPHIGRGELLSTTFETDHFETAEAFYSHPKMDAVVVCNESGNHGAAITLAAQHGKHILCEKPLEVTLPKIDAIEKLINTEKITLGVVYQNRWNPEYQRLKAAITEGLLGNLLLSNAQIHWYRPPEYYSFSPWRGTLLYDGGAALMNQGIHTIDLWLDLLGDLKYIYGKIDTKVHRIEGEDIAVAYAEFKNGVVGTLSGGTALFPGHPERIEIYGSGGSMCFSEGKITSSTIDAIPVSSSQKEAAEGKADPKINDIRLHQAVLDDFITALEQKKSPKVDLATARKSVALITELYESSKNNQP